MRIKKSALWGLALCIGAACQVQADDRIRDEIITTTDRSCGIHYLTHGNTVGWYLSEVEGACPNGFLNGPGQITLRNAFGKIVKTVNGFFAQGYPTQADYGEISLKTLWLSDSDSQSLVFDLGQEERLDIHYFGKMTANRSEDDSYSSFKTCDPAIILAVTPQTDLFEDESIQQGIINSVLTRIAIPCPNAHQIYLYGSMAENPENKDIVFFADINLETGHIKVRRLPSSPRIRDILTDPADITDIPIPKEIRRETGLPVVQVTPVKQGNKQPTVLPVKQVPSPKKSDIPLPEAESRFTLPPPLSVTPAESTLHPPVPEKEIQPVPEEPSVSLDNIPALLTASRLLKQPVSGKALVHIDRFDNTGLALTDGPVILRLKGQNLPIGRVIVTGNFLYTPKQTPADTVGFVEVQSFTIAPDKGEK